MVTVLRVQREKLIERPRKFLRHMETENYCMVPVIAMKRNRSLDPIKCHEM